MSKPSRSALAKRRRGPAAPVLEPPAATVRLVAMSLELEGGELRGGFARIEGSLTPETQDAFASLAAAALGRLAR